MTEDQITEIADYLRDELSNLSTCLDSLDIEELRLDLQDKIYEVLTIGGEDKHE